MPGCTAPAPPCLACAVRRPRDVEPLARTSRLAVSLLPAAGRCLRRVASRCRRCASRGAVRERLPHRAVVSDRATLLPGRVARRCPLRRRPAAACSCVAVSLHRRLHEWRQRVVRSPRRCSRPALPRQAPSTQRRWQPLRLHEHCRWREGCLRGRVQLGGVWYGCTSVSQQRCDLRATPDGSASPTHRSTRRATCVPRQHSVSTAYALHSLPCHSVAHLSRSRLPRIDTAPRCSDGCSVGLLRSPPSGLA